MTPKSVYGDAARNIQVSKECWIWTGTVTRKQSRDIPYIRMPNLKRVISIAPELQYLNGSAYRTTCLDELCVNPEHVTGMYTDEGRMLLIREKTARVGDCLIWQGELFKGSPFFPVISAATNRRTRMSVRKFNWCVEHIPAGIDWPTQYFTATCGNERCVEVSHAKVDIPAVGV